MDEQADDKQEEKPDDNIQVIMVYPEDIGETRFKIQIGKKLRVILANKDYLSSDIRG